MTRILRADDRVAGVVLADGSHIEAPVVINVTGPHSARINAMAGVDGDMTITTRPLRQEVVHLASPGGYDFEHEGPVVSDSDIAVYCRPETGNHILVGSEDPPCDKQEEVDPDDFDRSIGQQGVTQAFRYAQRVPGIEVPNRPRGVVDLYDVTEDWGPIYDRSSLDGFYMAIGTSGNQFKNAPVVGKMMTALVDYCEGGGDHDSEPLSFRLAHLDHTLDLASFSRRRRVNPDSSFSVLG
ncbi:MAG: FAD-dependent oxidoreductase [Geminicoccaceae bacterium]